MKIEGFVNADEMLRAGVYALTWRGKVVYIGKSKCMLNRIYQHKTLWGRKSLKNKVPSWMPVAGVRFDGIWVRPCMLEQMDALEQELIKKYKPQYNVTHKPVERTPIPMNLIIAGAKLSMKVKVPLTHATTAEPIRRRA